MTTTTYTLSVDTHAQQRLQLQHELYANSSQLFLLEAGLTDKMDVLEIAETAICLSWIQLFQVAGKIPS